MEPFERDAILQALRGDQRAFEEVIRAQSRKLFALAYGILQDAGEAEDAVQDSFLKAWKHRGSGPSPEKFQGWLFTICRNRAVDMSRKKRAMPCDEEQLESFEAVERAPDKAAASAEIGAHISSALSRLPERYRLALTMRYIEDLDARTIEEAMNISEGALRGILGRGLTALRERLKPVANNTP